MITHTGQPMTSEELANEFQRQKDCFNAMLGISDPLLLQSAIEQLRRWRTSEPDNVVMLEDSVDKLLALLPAPETDGK